MVASLADLSLGFRNAYFDHDRLTAQLAFADVWRGYIDFSRA